MRTLDGREEAGISKVKLLGTEVSVMGRVEEDWGARRRTGKERTNQRERGAREEELVEKWEEERDKEQGKKGEE